MPNDPRIPPSTDAPRPTAPASPAGAVVGPSAKAGPLAGLRVIEMAAIGPVPLAGMLLADLGADVVRIDRLQASGLGLDLAPAFDVNARGRRSIALDLKAPEGREIALRLIAGADVLLEGFRPGVMESLGLGPERCSALHPGLVYGRMTGYGQQGPLATVAGHDLNYIALTGVLHAIGPADGAPLPPLNLVGDYGGGALYLAFGVMAALFERQRSGCGQVVDAAMVDGAASLASIFHGLVARGDWRAARADNLLDGGAPFYACYEAACGGHVAVAALEPKFFAQLVQALDLDPAWVPRQNDRQHWPALRAALATRLAQRTRDDWADALQHLDVCCAPVLRFEEAADHPHAQARAAFVDIGGLRQPAPAPRFSRTPAATPQPAPEPGTHTTALLSEAGFSAAAIAELLARGIARAV